MSTTILTNGAIAYRTKPMELARAAAFAKCIEANAGRFTSVEISQARAKTEQYFVTFRPTSETRQGDLYQAEWDARQQRAQEEGAEYIFWRDTDNPGVDWVFNPKSGETYQVSTFGCTCPDYMFRCEKAGLLCKHQQARTIQADAGRLGKTDKVTVCTQTSESRESRNARMLANVARDF